MTTMVAPPHADPVTEGARIAQAAEDAGLELRVVGGVAVALRCASSASPPLSRTYKDVDVAGRAADRVRITALLTDAGYLADEQFNALNGDSAAALLRHPQPAPARRVPRPRRAVPQDRPAAAAVDPRRDAPARRPAADEAAGGGDQRQGLHATWRRCWSTSRSPTMTTTRSTSTTCAGSPAHDWGLWRTMTMVARRLETHAATLGDDAIGATVHEKVTDAARTPGEHAEIARLALARRASVTGVRWYELPDDDG